MTTAAITERWLLSRAITDADTNTTVQALEVPAKTFVAEVLLLITTAFDGGTPSVDVGDGDDADGWIDSGAITAATTGVYRGDETAGMIGAFQLGGKYYATADTIDAVVSASLTAGAARILARCLDLGNFL
jgi:hypothetical protein